MNKNTNVPLVNFRRLSIPAPWWLVMWIVIPYLLFKTIVWLVRSLPVLWRNRTSVTLTVLALWLWHEHGWEILALFAGVAGATVGVWWWRWRPWCERLIVLPVLSWWQRLFVYGLHWREAMTVCRLAERFDTKLNVPKLLRVRCTYATDEVLLRMPRGQNPDDYHAAAANLAYSFGARICRVYSGRREQPPARTNRFLRLVDRFRYRDRPRLVWLVFVRRDPLRRTVPAFDVPEETNLEALPLGVREDLVRYVLRLLATHVLIVGATRAGKGSVQWSLIRALAPAIRSGLVRLWGIDPKGGVELSLGRDLFSRYEYAEVPPMVAMLEELVEVMRERQARMQGKTRAHTPTLDEPLYVLMVDEILALVALLQDADLRARAKAALAMLLTQGAGLGVLVIGATQDPRKEVVELRDFFPTRIALRLNEPNHVDLVLGQGSRARGALCDQLSARPSMRGIGYVVLDDRPEPERVRFAYVTDDEIRDMAVAYAAPNVVQRPAVVPEQRRDPKHLYKPGRHAQGPLLPDSLTTFLDGEAA
ncbi:FtsK/SpoIIIE domain-containing protein [Dactylosporangium maewongense]|uniref:FtsK/SpoIIIE domain-containing protein n=1 Tax=Dactylosporangium maewongense TaxID=634393 RepID=A0ABN1ZW12_9ACTN